MSEPPTQPRCQNSISGARWDVILLPGQGRSVQVSQTRSWGAQWFPDWMLIEVPEEVL